jgi:hypothetical protein
MQRQMQHKPAPGAAEACCILQHLLPTADAGFDTVAAFPPPAPRGASFCFPPNITGVSATVDGQFYRLYTTAATWGAAAAVCDTAKGRLVRWFDYDTQLAVERVLFGVDNSVTAVNDYWMGGQSLMVDTRAGFRWTQYYGYTYGYYWMMTGDLWDNSTMVLPPYPSDEPPYAHWGDGEPSIWGYLRFGTTGAGWTGTPDGSYYSLQLANNMCMAAYENLAYAFVGPEEKRMANATLGNAWGWGRANCVDSKPYICIEQSELAVMPILPACRITPWHMHALDQQPASQKQCQGRLG